VLLLQRKIASVVQPRKLWRTVERQRDLDLRVRKQHMKDYVSIADLRRAPLQA
jgi:hypothetical protein